MRFCTHCGAQVPDNAKFCPACGTSIYAPDEATVTISDTVETTVSASAEAGEFVAASWSPSVPKTPEPPQPSYDSTPRNRKSVKNRKERSGKKKGFFHYVWLLLKVIIFAILAIFLIFFIIGFIQGYTS